MDQPLEQQPSAPKVSAIIVSYNCAAALRRCLAALERTREREKLEIVVVDMGSRDDCPRVDAEFPKAIMMRLERHFGMAKSLNIGIRTAQGEYLLLLDPNVEVAPGTVAELAARLDTEADAVAVCPLIVDPEGRPASVVRALPARERPRCDQTVPLDLEQEAISVPVADGGAVMARKFFIRGLNYFDERFGHHLLDVELGYQIRRSSKKTLLLPRLLVVRRPPEDSFPLDTASRAALSADRALAAATFARKHFGAGAGIKLRVAITLGAIGRVLKALFTMGEAGYEFGRMSAIVTGQKIDGSQRAL
jgi:N-acetylglucosaminyl-diphospho-decaprenol L-rhamnosyltransferase